MAVELIHSDAPVNTGEAERVRTEALDLAASLAQPPGVVSPDDALALVTDALEDRNPLAERRLAEVEDAEAKVTDHRGGGPGSTIRACNATSAALERAVELADQVGREVDRVREDDDLSDSGRQHRIAAILTAHREAVEREVGQKFKVALDNLDEREAALRRGLAATNAEPLSETQRLADRIDMLALMMLVGRSADALEGAVLSLASRGDRRAGPLLETAAHGLKDPLKVRTLTMRVRGLESARRSAGLLGDDTRGRAAAELYLIGVTKGRIENVRKMLGNNPSEARLLAHNWR